MKVAQSCLTLCDSIGCPWNSPGQNIGLGGLSLLQGISPIQGLNPGIEPRSPALHEDSLPAEPQEKPCLDLLEYNINNLNKLRIKCLGVEAMKGI